MTSVYIAYPYSAQSRIVADRGQVFDWMIENLSQPAAYNYKPLDWTRVWKRKSRKLLNRQYATISPRAELFRFMDENDAMLFSLRWG